MGDESPVASLVERIIAGDAQGEDEFVRRYKDGVSVIINRIVRDQSVTEDLSQETFIIALEKIRKGDVREPERVSGFVCGIARNHAIEFIRKARQLANQQEIGEAEQLQDPTPNPRELILERERYALVRQVIQELPVPRDRHVLFRFYIAEDSKEEICADLRLTGKQFDNTIHRAKKRYKELYLKRMGDP